MNLSPKIPDWVPDPLRDRRLWWTLMGCGLALWQPDALRRILRLMQGYADRQSQAILQELEDALGSLGVSHTHIRLIVSAIPRQTDHLS